MNIKPAIAIIVPGGIGDQDNIPVLIELLRSLSELFDLSIYSFSGAQSHPFFTSSSCRVITVPSGIKSNILKAVYCIWKIWKDHSIKRFALIHGFWIMLQGIVAVLAGRLLKIPALVTLPGGDITYLPAIHYGSLSNPVKRKLAAWCIYRASHIVMLTRFQQTVMQQHGISRNQISIIPFGVDISKFEFHPHPFAAPLQLLYIGNLNRVKDPFTLVRTFHFLTKRLDCRLTIIGSDTLNGALQAYARELGEYERIRWLGKLPHEEISLQLSSADILLMTSLYEGQSVVVLEAFAKGVIVAGTNVGLLADIKDDALTISPGDAEGLAKIVEELIRHPENIASLQLKNRKYAETISADWTFKEYLKLYYELIPERQT